MFYQHYKSEKIIKKAKTKYTSQKQKAKSYKIEPPRLLTIIIKMLFAKINCTFCLNLMKLNSEDNENDNINETIALTHRDPQLSKNYNKFWNLMVCCHRCSTSKANYTENKFREIMNKYRDDRAMMDLLYSEGRKLKYEQKKVRKAQKSWRDLSLFQFFLTI